MSIIQTIVGLAWVAIGTLLYAGQFVSAVNFPLAQRLGLQEKSESTDPLIGKLELMAARWDVVCLWIPPLAGLLMLLDQAAWPAACLIAGGVYVDAGGREWAKILGLRSHGVPFGSGRERTVIYATFAFLILAGVAGIVLGLAALI